MKNLNFYVSWDLVRMECCAVIVRIISLKAQLLRIILVKSVHRWLSPWGHCSFSLTPSSVHLKQIARMHHPSHPPVTSVVFWPFWAVSWLWAGLALRVRARRRLMPWLCRGLREFAGIPSQSCPLSSPQSGGRVRTRISLKINLFIWLRQLLVAVRGIWFPDQGSNPGPCIEYRVLATGPPGESQLTSSWCM